MLEYLDMYKYLLALSKFTICLDSGCTQNMRYFSVLLHDEPLKVENTNLYSIVKKWRSQEDVSNALNSIGLPPAFPSEETKTKYVRFFQQTYYRGKPEEKVRLLCWGECKTSVGSFSFVLPQIVCTRFITLVGTGVHTNGTEYNLDVKKSIPHAQLVPCL